MQQAGRCVKEAARSHTWMRTCSDSCRCGQRNIRLVRPEPSHAGRASGSGWPSTSRSRSRSSPEKLAAGPWLQNFEGPVQTTPATRSPEGDESAEFGGGQASWPYYHKPARQRTQPWSRVHAPRRVASDRLLELYAVARRRNVRTFIRHRPRASTALARRSWRHVSELVPVGKAFEAFPLHPSRPASGGRRNRYRDLWHGVPRIIAGDRCALDRGAASDFQGGRSRVHVETEAADVRTSTKIQRINGRSDDSCRRVCAAMANRRWWRRSTRWMGMPSRAWGRRQPISSISCTPLSPCRSIQPSSTATTR